MNDILTGCGKYIPPTDDYVEEDKYLDEVDAPNTTCKTCLRVVRSWG